MAIFSGFIQPLGQPGIPFSYQWSSFSLHALCSGLGGMGRRGKNIKRLLSARVQLVCNSIDGNEVLVVGLSRGS